MLQPRTGLRAAVIGAFGMAAGACGAVGGAEHFVPYLGQTPPGSTPEHFAPGVVNTEAIEINGVFSPDGRSFFFARRLEGVFHVFRADFGPAGWAAPSPMPLYADGERAMAVDMSITTDGRSLYFLGQKRRTGASDAANLDVWVARHDGRAWGFAELVPPPVSTDAPESYPVVVSDGSLYFTSERPGGFGKYDVYRAQRRADGGFEEPVNLGPPVNTEFHEGDTFVAPDESYLILSSSRPGGFGQNDLYVSFRAADGGWTQPANLGPAINTEQTDFCPMVTPDGKWLCFSRRTGASWAEATEGEIFWVDVGVIEEFRRGR